MIMAWQLSQGDGKGSMRYRFIQMLCLFVCLLFQTVGKSLVDEIRFIQTFCLSACLSFVNTRLSCFRQQLQENRSMKGK